MWAMIIMEILRRPQWTFRYSDWTDADRFMVSNIRYATANCIITVDIIALIILGTGLCLDFGYEIYHCANTNARRSVLHPDDGSTDPPAPLPTSQQSRPVSSSIDTIGMQLSEVASVIAEEAFSVPSVDTGFHTSNDTSLSSLRGSDGMTRRGTCYIWTLRADPERYFRRVALYVLLCIYILKWCEVIFGVLFISLRCGGEGFALRIQGSAWSTIFPLDCICAVLIETRYIPLLKTTLRTTPRFLYLLVLLAVALGGYTAMVKFLLRPHDSAAELYFHSYWEGLWTMFNVMNAANWPDPFVACYKASVYCTIRDVDNCFIS